MSNRIKNNLKNLVGQTLNQYYSKVKPTISDLRYKQEYQNRIIECMVGEVDDNYIETPETDAPIVKLEHSKEGVVKIPSIKGKTILVDADGNETDTPAEGCRLVSVGEEDNKLIILSKNKNLFDKSNIIYNKYFSGGGAVGNTITFANSNRHCCVLIKVQPNTNYVFCSKNLLCYLREMQTETIENGGILDYSKKHYFITKEGTNYLAINIRLEDASGTITSKDVDTSNIIVAKTTEGESYVEPKHHKTEILLNEPLRKLPNGVCDEIVGNKVIRNTKKVVLNGSENWGKRAGSENIISYCFECRLSTMGISQYSTPCISNNLPTNVGDWKDVEHIWLNEWGSATVHISAEKIGEYDVDKFKEWLSNNPIELIYQIEPIIEELPNGITLQGFDDTTMYIENSITPMVTYGYNALIPYKQELLQQKEEVEINTLDIENNIIPYLMDMEFNLMTMEDNE